MRGMCHYPGRCLGLYSLAPSGHHGSPLSVPTNDGECQNMDTLCPDPAIGFVVATDVPPHFFRWLGQYRQRRYGSRLRAAILLYRGMEAPPTLNIQVRNICAELCLEFRHWRDHPGTFLGYENELPQFILHKIILH